MSRENAPKTFAEKALARAAGLAVARAGELVEARPDRVLTHDNTAAIARIFADQLGRRRVSDPEQLCITLDHAAPPPTPNHAQNHAETRRFVREQGVRHFFEVGRGICHQVLSEEGLVLPGNMVLGADSHTTHYGWLGAFGAGVGRSEAAVLWATGRLWLRVPESLRFHLAGELPPGVTTKDLSLSIIGQLGADGGLFTSVEFAGLGLGSLSLESRMVIPNMMAEFGVKNAFLPPDEAVFEYLAERVGHSAQKTKDDGRRLAVIEELKERALYPDEGARYLAEYSLDLGQIEPLVACPHSVAAVLPLSQVAGRKIDLAFIGTCTNGRLEDLAAAAEALRGRKVHPGTRLLVIPASSQVYHQALQAGVLEVLVEAGASIGTPGCGPCMGNHLGIPAAGETVLSTANRNFRGRMGQPEAEIFLASPAVVAVSAVLGRIGHPEELEPRRGSPKSGRVGALQSWNRTPEEFPLNPSVRPDPSENATPDEFFPSQRDGLPARPTGNAWRYGDNINTDQIFPGKYTYTLAAPREIAAHALEDLDPDFAGKVQAGDVIFGGRNFGCGSSREQAVTCLVGNGVAAIVAVSFARIFYRNAINQGLAAIVCPPAVQAARPGDAVQVDLAAGLVHLPAGSFAFPPFPEHVQVILRAGGLVPLIREKYF